MSFAEFQTVLNDAWAAGDLDDDPERDLFGVVITEVEALSAFLVSECCADIGGKKNTEHSHG